MTDPNWKVRIYFDGECPLCSKEIRIMQSKDHKQRIDFVDFTAANFDPATHDKTRDDFMTRIQGDATFWRVDRRR